MNINTGNIPTRKLFKTKIFLISIFSLGVFTSFFSPLLMSKCSNGSEPIIDPEPFEANEIPKDWLIHNEDYTVVSGLVDLTQDYSKYDTLRIPETVTSIADKSFENVFASDKITPITKIIIGGKVGTIGSDAFTGWDTLESIHIHESNTSFSVSTIKNGDSTIGQFLMQPTGLTNSFKTEGLSWGSLQFTAANMAPGNTTIGSKCFSKAKAVTSIDFSNLTEIKDYAFSDLPKLTKIDLKTVSKIGNNCFSNDSNVTILSSQYATTPTVGSSVFSGWTAEGMVDNTLGTLSSESLCNTLLGKSLPNKWTYTGGWVPYSLLDVDGQMVKGFKSNVDITKYTSLKIYDGITTVAKDAFATSLSSKLTPNITSLFLGANVSSVNTVTGSKSFSSWDNLSKIVVSPSNTTYKVITMVDNAGELLVPIIGLQSIHMTSVVAHGNIVIDQTITKSSRIDVHLGGCAAITGVEIGTGINTLAGTIQDNDNIKSIFVGPSVTSLESSFYISKLANLDSLVFNSFPSTERQIMGSGLTKLQSISWNSSSDITPSWASTTFNGLELTTGVMFYENDTIVFNDIQKKFTDAGMKSGWKVFNAAIKGPAEITNRPYYGNGNDYTFTSTIPSSTGKWDFAGDYGTKSVLLDPDGEKCCLITEGQYTSSQNFQVKISYEVDLTIATMQIKVKVFFDITVKTTSIPRSFTGVNFEYRQPRDEYIINGLTPTPELEQIRSIICPDYYDDGTHGLKKIGAIDCGIRDAGTFQEGWVGYLALESMKFSRHMSGLFDLSQSFDYSHYSIFYKDQKIKDVYMPRGITGWADTFYQQRDNVKRTAIPTDWSKKYYACWISQTYPIDGPDFVAEANIFSIVTYSKYITIFISKLKNLTFGNETEGSELKYLPAANFSVRGDKSVIPNMETLTLFATVPPIFVYSNKSHFDNLFVGTVDAFKIKVPAESLEAYKNAPGWSLVKDKIIAITK